MQEIIENYKSLWLRSIEERKAIARVGSQAKFMMLNRTRLMEESATEIEEFLWNEFKVCKENLYYLHLRIAEYCLTTWFDDVNEKEASVLFLNRTFDNWTRNYASIVQKEQLKKMKTNEATADSAAAATSQPNLLALETYHILKAFDLAVKNVNLFSSFNRIYKFDQNFNVLRVKMDELVQKIDGLNLFKIISELKVNDIYHIDYEPIVVPLMISDKYKQIEELINSNENTLISIVELCDKLCATNTNFKKIAEKYDCKKSNRFGGSQVSKFALNLLKRSKKAHLVYSTYLGIQFQLRLNQLRFLVYQAYNPADPMSFEGWSELAIDLIGNDERLIGQLFSEIVQYNKDINMGIFFAEKYGYDYIRRLPSQTQDFFDKNLPMLKSKYMENIELKWTPSKLNEFYFPDDLKDENIVFVDDEKKFVDMLDYFEAKKPDIIGLDCEWKPTFGPDDSEMTPEVMAQAASSPNWNGDKNQRANTLQIATRERSFVVEVRDLVDSLSKEHLDRFGQLVLFDDNILKLGYGFDQDAQRLNHSFWKFQHRLCEFTQSVVNMDEIATDVQRRYNLFGDDPGEKPFITKPSESDLAKIASTSSMASAATAAEPIPNNNGNNNNNQKQPSGTPKPKGLSKLTFLCFGKPLDKRECMSNWANRPLRRAQLRYAALDAFVLIKINDLFVEKFKALNIEFDYLLGGRKSFF